TTDLFTSGRHQEHTVMRGVADANALIAQGANCSIATNNVLNPFTPYGDCSLVRRSEEHTSELQSQSNLVCRLLLEKKKKTLDNGRDAFPQEFGGLGVRVVTEQHRSAKHDPDAFHRENLRQPKKGASAVDALPTGTS